MNATYSKNVPGNTVKEGTIVGAHADADAPSEQMVHADAPAAEKEPAAQEAGSAVVEGQNEPAGQRTHADAPPVEYVPVAQVPVVAQLMFNTK